MELVKFCELRVLTDGGRVMTPRPASEKIVAEAVALIGDRTARVVDVGTGSGAIALAIAAALPKIEVFATDTSIDAVALARINAARLGLSGRVTVCRGDLLEAIGGPLDLIVANLPYLPVAGARLRPDLLDEPPDAVFAAGDGLELYRRLIAASRQRLSRSGSLMIQLHREVLTASLGDLDTLAAAVAGSTLSEPLTELPIAA
jgi:release factor glutamine methyltransferase